MSPGSPPGGPWRLLARGVVRNKAKMAGFLALLTLWQLCETLVPVMIGLVIDRAVATSEWSALGLWGGALVVLFAVLSFAYRFGSRLGFWVVQHEMHRIRLEIATHALDPRGARTRLLPGEVLSLATADTDNVGFAIRSLGYSFASLGALVVSAWVLLSIDLGLGLVVLLGVPVVVAVIQLATPALARRTTRQQATIGRATGVATDLVRGLRVLKGVGGEDEAARRYRRLSGHARAAGIRSAQSWGTLAGLTTLMSGGFLALIALLAGSLALDGEISIGELVMVVGLTQYLAEPLEVVGAISAQTARAVASARRITDYLATPRLVAVGERAPIVPAAWTIEPGADRSRVGVRLRSEPGELLGLAVDDPTTAAALVRDLAEGSPGIRVDGEPLDELSTDARRQHLVVNPHHVDLFEGTLRSNIDPDARLGDAALAAVLEASSAADVVALSADGLDQHVSPDGITYSGGQRQRIALARALAADPPLLVLHDPTTAVDAVTEHRIAVGIQELRHRNDIEDTEGTDTRRTTWLVTNAPALLARADRVLVVRDGRLVAEGTHHHLLEDAGYQDLVLR